MASPQLRNQGTIGGNLCQKPRCWYYRGEFHCLRKGGDTCYAVAGENKFHCVLGGENCFMVHPSDTAPMLIALGASVAVSGPKGPRRIAVENLYVSPSRDPRRETVLEAGEVITEIVIPKALQRHYSSYRKIRARRSWDFALAGIALALQFDGPRVLRARVALSGAAPVPWRSKEVEEVINGTESRSRDRRQGCIGCHGAGQSADSERLQGQPLRGRHGGGVGARGGQNPLRTALRQNNFSALQPTLSGLPMVPLKE